jgi:leucine dehydrogenase
VSDPFRWLQTDQRLVVWQDRSSGLQALCVVDHLVDGIAAGGIRTRRYANAEAAVRDASQLARAMTLKCALASLPVGGCKTVVMQPPDWDRRAAFEALGERLAELGGVVRTAGDLGTGHEDLEAVARHYDHVHLDEAGLSHAVARGLVGCVRACAAVRGVDVAGLVVAVQGVGAIGTAVVRALAEAGAELRISDIDATRADAVARAHGATAVDAARLLDGHVDVFAPCAIGGVVDEALADTIGAWAVVGAANNVLASDAAGRRLHERGVLFVPDVIASAGAAVDGIGQTVMGLADRGALIDALADTAAQVLARSARDDAPPQLVASAIALERLKARTASPR